MVGCVDLSFFFPPLGTLQYRNPEAGSCSHISLDSRRKADILFDLPHGTLTPQEAEKSQLVLTGPSMEKAGSSDGNQTYKGPPALLASFA